MPKVTVFKNTDGERSFLEILLVICGEAAGCAAGARINADIRCTQAALIGPRCRPPTSSRPEPARVLVVKVKVKKVKK